MQYTLFVLDVTSRTDERPVMINEAVTMHIYSDSRDNIEKAIKSVDDMYKEQIDTKSFKCKCRLTPEEVSI